MAASIPQAVLLLMNMQDSGLILYTVMCLMRCKVHYEQKITIVFETTGHFQQENCIDEVEVEE